MNDDLMRRLPHPLLPSTFRRDLDHESVVFRAARQFAAGAVDKTSISASDRSKVADSGLIANWSFESGVGPRVS